MKIKQPRGGKRILDKLNQLSKIDLSDPNCEDKCWWDLFDELADSPSKHGWMFGAWCSITNPIDSDISCRNWHANYCRKRHDETSLARAAAEHPNLKHLKTIIKNGRERLDQSFCPICGGQSIAKTTNKEKQ